MRCIDCPNAENRMVTAGVAAVNDIIHTTVVRAPAPGNRDAILTGTTQNGNIYLFTAANGTFTRHRPVRARASFHMRARNPSITVVGDSGAGGGAGGDVGGFTKEAGSCQVDGSPR
eukprot:1844044-Prymnesium_polylepis.1